MIETRNKNFLSLATGSFISTIGDHLYNFALTIWLYEMSNSIGTVAGMWLQERFLEYLFNTYQVL